MKNLARLLLASIIIFEALNWLKILNFSLDFSWLGLIGTAAVIWLILEISDFFPGYICLVAVVGVYLDALSDIFNFYSRFGSWDRWVHLLGGALTAIVVLYIFLRLEKSGQLLIGNKFLWLAVICVITLLGFLYEYWEFLIDKFYFGYEKALGSGPDTVDDLMLNLVGSGAVLVNYYLIQLKRWRRFF